MPKLHRGLKAEIEFWQELIIQSRSGIHSREFKRIEQAMYFAQMKLLNHEHPLMQQEHQSITL